MFKATRTATLLTAIGLVAVPAAQASVLLGDIDITGPTSATTLASSGETIVVDPSNIGDIRFTVDGVTPKQSEGVLFGYSTEAGIGGLPRQQVATVGDVTTNVDPDFADYWFATHNITNNGTETRFDLSFVYFPFADGWVSGTVATAGNVVAGTGNGFTATKRTGQGVDVGNYNLSINGVNSATDGYLFTIGAENDDNYTMTRFDGNGGWDVLVIDENDNGVQSGAAGEDGAFSFVYIPETAPNLIAGRVDDDGSVLKNTGDFTVTTDDTSLSVTLDTGQYFLQISDGNGGFLGREDGVLMLNVEKDVAASGGGFDGPDDNFLLQDYVAADEGFRVSSYDLASAPRQTTEWSFAFIQFDNPVQIPEPTTALMLAPTGLFLMRRRNRA
ncbi:MAG: hypothetical protein KTR15_02975 [Phycisphaeraceae bacterium]|nr:hypothetical protein [Phycisphaeraceae bacterium]